MAKTTNAELMRKIMVFSRRTMAAGHRGRPHGGRGPEGMGDHGPEGPCGHGPMGIEGPCGHGPEGAGGRMCEGGPGPRRHAPHGRGPRGNGMLMRERLLEMIAEHEGGIRQRDLAEQAGTNPSSMSELVSKLEDDGYVRRVVDPDDRRATLVTLTEMGTARACEVADEREQMFADVFRGISEEEKETLDAILDKLLAAQGGPDEGCAGRR